jgi:hypothetical protein
LVAKRADVLMTDAGVGEHAGAPTLLGYSVWGYSLDSSDRKR